MSELSPPSHLGRANVPKRLGAFPILAVIGQSSLAALLTVIPVFNPALAVVGEERFYLANLLVVLAIAMAGVIWLQRRRPAWVIATFTLAVIYSILVGLSRFTLDLGVLANAYRPLQPVLLFCACWMLLPLRSETFLRLALVGGVVGCALAALNTIIPSIDPFVMQPELPWESTYGSLERQAGAFVYPNNLGTYAAYLAIAGLVCLETRSLRPGVGLSAAAFVAGVVGIVVSGSRSGVLALSCALVVSLLRTRTLRRPIAAVVLVIAVLSVAIAGATGVLGEVLTHRLLDSSESLESPYDGMGGRVAQLQRLPPLWSGRGCRNDRLHLSLCPERRWSCRRCACHWDAVALVASTASPGGLLDFAASCGCCS